MCPCMVYEVRVQGVQSRCYMKLSIIIVNIFKIRFLKIMATEVLFKNRKCIT